jgi:predicted ABC-type ATPase
MAGTPRIILIAGPNGAGKTTFAKEFLPHEAACQTFINADLIASGLSPFAPEAAAIQAGKIMLSMIDEKVAAHESFVLETTLSGRTYARQIPQWRAAGFHVSLHFLRLHSSQQAIERVANRVIHGGHNIPSDVIERRFHAGYHNFNYTYKSLVNRWFLYDNSGSIPMLLESGMNL